MAAEKLRCLLDVADLSVWYGGVRALSSVDVSIPWEGAVAVIGPNGAGKTTLAKTITGLTRAAQGRVMFGGADITEMPVEKRVRLGISLVPEGRGVIGALTVNENLLIGGYVRSVRTSAEQLEHVYSTFPALQNLRRRPAKVLSGGELQLLALGRAMMNRPRLLIVDEPSMGLAPIALGRVRDALRHMLDAGDAGLLLIEQNVRLAFELCEYVYVLDRGSIVRHGRAAELELETDIQAAYLGGG